MTTFNAPVVHVSFNGSETVFHANAVGSERVAATHEISFTEYLPSIEEHIEFRIACTEMHERFVHSGATGDVNFRFSRDDAFTMSDDDIFNPQDETHYVSLLNSGLNLTVPDRCVVTVLDTPDNEEEPGPYAFRAASSSQPTLHYITDDGQQVVLVTVEFNIHHHDAHTWPEATMTVIANHTDMERLLERFPRLHIPGAGEFIAHVMGIEHRVDPMQFNSYNDGILRRGVVGHSIEITARLEQVPSQAETDWRRPTTAPAMPSGHQFVGMDLAAAEDRIVAHALNSDREIEDMAGSASSLGETIRNIAGQFTTVGNLFRPMIERAREQQEALVRANITRPQGPSEHPSESTYTPEVTFDTEEQTATFRNRVELTFDNYLRACKLAEDHDVSFAQVVEVIIEHGNALEEAAVSAGLSYGHMEATALRALPTSDEHPVPPYRRYGTTRATFFETFEGYRVPSDYDDNTHCIPYEELLPEEMAAILDASDPLQGMNVSVSTDESEPASVANVRPMSINVSLDIDGSHEDAETVARVRGIVDRMVEDRQARTVGGVPIELATSEQLDNIARLINVDARATDQGVAIETDESFRNRIVEGLIRYRAQHGNGTIGAIDTVGSALAETMQTDRGARIAPPSIGQHVIAQTNEGRTIQNGVVTMVDPSGGTVTIDIDGGEMTMNISNVHAISGDMARTIRDARFFIDGQELDVDNIELSELNITRDELNTTMGEFRDMMRAGRRDTFTSSPRTYTSVQDFNDAFTEVADFAIKVTMHRGALTIEHDPRDKDALVARHMEIRDSIPISLNLILKATIRTPMQFTKGKRRLKIERKRD